MFVYIVKHGAVLGVSGGLVTIKYPDGTSESVPKNIVEGVSIFSRAVMTTPFIDYCLRNGVNVGFSVEVGYTKAFYIAFRLQILSG